MSDWNAWFQLIFHYLTPWLKALNNNLTYTGNDLIIGTHNILSWTNKWNVLDLEAC